MSAFKLSDEVLEQYRRLEYDPTANYESNLLPIATIYWPDEHPEGQLPMKVDEESKRSLLSLVSARTSLWYDEKIPEHLRTIWEEAQETIPNWPGFKRLVLTNEQRQAADACFDETIGIMDVFLGGADEARLEQTAEGVTQWSATFNLIEPEEDE